MSDSIPVSSNIQDVTDVFKVTAGGPLTKIERLCTNDAMAAAYVGFSNIPGFYRYLDSESVKPYWEFVLNKWIVPKKDNARAAGILVEIAPSRHLDQINRRLSSNCSLYLGPLDKIDTALWDDEDYYAFFVYRVLVAGTEKNSGIFFGRNLSKAEMVNKSVLMLTMLNAKEFLRTIDVEAAKNPQKSPGGIPAPVEKEPKESKNFLTRHMLNDEDTAQFLGFSGYNEEFGEFLRSPLLRPHWNLAWNKCKPRKDHSISPIPMYLTAEMIKRIKQCLGSENRFELYSAEPSKEERDRWPREQHYAFFTHQVGLANTNTEGGIFFLKDIGTEEKDIKVLTLLQYLVKHGRLLD